MNAEQSGEEAKEEPKAKIQCPHCNAYQIKDGTGKVLSGPRILLAGGDLNAGSNEVVNGSPGQREKVRARRTS